MRIAAKFMRLFLVLAILTTGLAMPAHAAGDYAAAVPDATVRNAVCRAVFWLHRQQKPDGGFGTGDRSSVAVTADVAYALGIVGEDVDGPKWTTTAGKDALDALVALNAAGYAKADPGQAGKVARAVALAGADPRSFAGTNLVTTIQGFYDPATGLYHPSFLFRHTLAVEGLLRSGESVPQGAYDALLASQLPDGGWFWSKNGTVGDVDTTGRVLQVLGGFAAVSAPAAYTRAVNYLAAGQLTGGGWNTGYEGSADPANGNSTALAVGGLMAVGEDPQAARFVKNGKGALETLLSFQKTSGEFAYLKTGSDSQTSPVIATADALSALAPLVEGQPVCGTTYLPLLLAR
jgi:hypothetical protein